MSDTARDRAIALVMEEMGPVHPHSAEQFMQAQREVDALAGHPEVLRALAGEAGAAADWEGACVRLSREDWGVVIDALIEHRRSAERRKAGNSESTSDVRVETCVRLVAELGALLSVPPATAPARLRETLGVAPGS